MQLLGTFEEILLRARQQCGNSCQYCKNFAFDLHDIRHIGLPSELDEESLRAPLKKGSHETGGEVIRDRVDADSAFPQSTNENICNGYVTVLKYLHPIRLSLNIGTATEQHVDTSNVFCTEL